MRLPFFPVRHNRNFFPVLAPAAILAASAALLIDPVCAQIAVRNQGYVPFSDAPINYRSNDLHDPVANLQRRLDTGRATLAFDDRQGYLKSVLELLNIPVSSQTLVFSKTSFNTRRLRRKLRARFTSTTMSTSVSCTTARLSKWFHSIRCRARSSTFSMHTRQRSPCFNGRNSTAPNATLRLQRATCPESLCDPSFPAQAGRK